MPRTLEKMEKKETILVVDDNPTNLSLLLDTLEMQNFKVLVAKDGQSAIDKALQNMPNLILLDVMMPGMDGFETCKVLKSNELTKLIPIIFMTALREMSDKIKGFNIGGVDYITKPFNPKEVLIRVNAHLTIEKQRKQLAELNASKDMFFSIVAHDLKNVFMYVPQLSKILIDSVDTLSNTEIKEISLRLHEDSRQAQSLFENLLEWSRIQIGAIKYEPVTFLINTLLLNCFELYESAALSKNISIEISSSQLISIEADKHMVFTVIRNLLYNAIKFTNFGGKIILDCKVRDSKAIISIQDSGVGIPEEKLSKLFKIDQKITTSGTSKEKGTGLGLILCKDLLLKNNGDIWVESELGKGSTFSFSLPYSETN